MKQAYEHVCQWNVEDNIQRKKIIKTRKELLAIVKNKKILSLLKKEHPFKKFMYFNHEDKLAMQTFSYSIIYLMLLFAFLLIDHYIPMIANNL